LHDNVRSNDHTFGRQDLGKPSNLYFWRDHQGREIDLIAAEADQLHATEIKSGATLHSSFFDSLQWFAKTAGSALGEQRLVYGGDRPTRRDAIEVIPWFSLKP
ncbi:MAG: DUF4143 domain-containing protein, partial [Verrucomicrobiota bacterium]